MPRKSDRLPNRPPRDQWDSLPRTASEAKRKGTPYWFKRDSAGQPVRCENGHVDLKITATDDCVRCKRTSDGRTRSADWRKSEKGQQYYKDRKEEGLARGSVPGYRAGYPSRVPSWLTAKDINALIAKREMQPKGMEADHIIDPNHIKHGNLISGIETAQNLQYLTRSESQKKGSHLPDPKNWKVRASRPLTMEEMRFFVSKGMAVWSKDVVKGKVKWKLYQRQPDGTIIYLGVEPESIRAAAE